MRRAQPLRQPRDSPQGRRTRSAAPAAPALGGRDAARPRRAQGRVRRFLFPQSLDQRRSGAFGAPVVPVFALRDGVSSHHFLECMEPIETFRGADREEAVLINTQRYTKTIEDMVRRYPDHWNWIHRRWKTRPAGEQRFY